jgi:succinate-semialdehyde dehydrogenase/glutarate-semialdehyde dehydrogenase
MLSFTGSVAVGRALAETAGRHLKPCILELGGHAPVIVCADADPADVIRQAVVAKFRNSGQICISPTRFLVHDSLADGFAAGLARAAAALRVGDPLDPATEMGPLIHERRLRAVEALVGDAVAAGARILTGGHRLRGNGSFYAPTVLSEIPEAARILTEEPFGPVALVQRFRDLDEACERANATSLGLAAYAFTASSRAAAVIADRIEAGILSINHFGGASPEVPFGGVKDSGYGREGGSHCFDGYLVPKAVSHRTYSA